jgi:serine/threonine-protein kinase
MNEAPPSRGLVAGKYELLQQIGRGGMGSVWEARHATLGHKVAIKFIESDIASTEEARKRFDNEAKAAATIQSKHAIQIFDHGVTDDGKPFIVMERLVGEPLDKRIERVRMMPLQEVGRIIQQVCRALARAHEGGIVHRDLKPENIFLTRSNDDDDEVAKVLDFGIAKMRNPTQDHGVSSSTKTGAVLGTPYYMSPEQARGLRTVDYRSDLWSLGVIAFKCVTGRLPFEGESLGDLLVKICTSPIPAPSQMVQGIPPAFDAWFLRALDREPNRRFQSAQELSDALAFACGISVKRGPTSGSHSGPTTQPTPQFPMGTPIPTPAPGMMHTPYSAVPNVTSAPFTSTPTQKEGRGAWVFLLVAMLIGVPLIVGGSLLLFRKPATAGATVSGTSPTVVTQTTQTVQTTAATNTTPTVDVNTLPPLTTATTPTNVAVGTRPTIKPGTTATVVKPGTSASTKPTTTAPTTTTTTTAPTGTGTHKPPGSDCNGCGF